MKHEAEVDGAPFLIKCDEKGAWGLFQAGALAMQQDGMLRRKGFTLKGCAQM